MSTTSELGTRQQVELGIQAGKSAVDAMQELTNDKGTKYEREEKVGRGGRISHDHMNLFSPRHGRRSALLPRSV